MTLLVIAGLLGLSVWLAWPSQPTGRLDRLRLHRGAAAQGQVQVSSGDGVAWSWLRASLDRMPMGPWAKRRRAAHRARLTEALSALAAELAAGQPPSQALALAAGDPPVWPAALAAMRLNASIADGLREDSRHEPTLRSLAACWEVGETSGSGLSTAIDRLASSARSSDEVRVQLESELAAPRATSRLLALLPAFGVVIALALGVDPIGWLTGSLIGWACLVAALALMAIGMAWTNRIAAGVERRL